MLNINWGNKRELMKECQRLREYSQCIAAIRHYEALIADREEAIAKAVDVCIANGWLADILSKNKSEVVALFLTEYDEQAQRELDREEAREDGKYLQLIRIARIKAEKGISAKDTAQMLEEPENLIEKFYELIGENPDWSEEMIYEKYRNLMS